MTDPLAAALESAQRYAAQLTPAQRDAVQRERRWLTERIAAGPGITPDEFVRHAPNLLAMMRTFEGETCACDMCQGEATDE